MLNVLSPIKRDAYTGTWSESSSLWTEILRKAVGPVINEGDGVFFMTVVTLVSVFDRIEYKKMSPPARKLLC